VDALVVRVQTAVRLAIATLFPTVKGAHVVLVQPMALQAIDQHDAMTMGRVNAVMMTDRRVRVVMMTDQRALVVKIVEMTDHVRVVMMTDRRVRVVMMTDEVRVAMTTDQ
jgi:hypothetical protein